MAASAILNQRCRSTVFHQMGRADNECAEALLELAMSVTPVKEEPPEFPSPPPSQETSTWPTAGEVVGQKSSLLADFINCALMQEEADERAQAANLNERKRSMSPPGPETQEAFKRIKLDHNYCLSAWRADPESHEMQNLSVQAMPTMAMESSSLDDVDVSSPGHSIATKKQVDLKWNKENNDISNDFQVKTEVVSEEEVSVKTAPPTSCNPTKIVTKQVTVMPPEKKAVKRAPAKKKAVKTESLKDESSPKSRKQSASGGGSKKRQSRSKVAYEEDRFKGFHMLLKSLAEKEENDRQLQKEEAAARAAAAATGASEPYDDSETESEEETGSSDHSLPLAGPLHMFFKCGLCSKTFSKKRYLTKHARRMHPGFSLSKIQEEAAIACPHCLKVISKKNFKRHLGTCKVATQRWSSPAWDQDTATCQFCRVKLKRHMLVKHLADKHCVERNMEMHIASSLMTSGDSSASCSYGKPHCSRETSPSANDLTVCQLCNVLLPQNELPAHMTSRHACNLDVPMVQCAFCEQEVPLEEKIAHLREAHRLQESGLAQLQLATMFHNVAFKSAGPASMKHSSDPTLPVLSHSPGQEDHSSPSAVSVSSDGPLVSPSHHVSPVSRMHAEISAQLTSSSSPPSATSPLTSHTPPTAESALLTQINQVYSNPPMKPSSSCSPESPAAPKKKAKPRSKNKSPKSPRKSAEKLSVRPVPVMDACSAMSSLVHAASLQRYEETLKAGSKPRASPCPPRLVCSPSSNTTPVDAAIPWQFSPSQQLSTGCSTVSNYRPPAPALSIAHSPADSESARIFVAPGAHKPGLSTMAVHQGSGPREDGR